MEFLRTYRLNMGQWQLTLLSCVSRTYFRICIEAFAILLTWYIQYIHWAYGEFPNTYSPPGCWFAVMFCPIWDHLKFSLAELLSGFKNAIICSQWNLYPINGFGNWYAVKFKISIEYCEILMVRLLNSKKFQSGTRNAACYSVSPSIRQHLCDCLVVCLCSCMSCHLLYCIA